MNQQRNWKASTHVQVKPDPIRRPQRILFSGELHDMGTPGIGVDDPKYDDYDPCAMTWVNGRFYVLMKLRRTN